MNIKHYFVVPYLLWYGKKLQRLHAMGGNTLFEWVKARYELMHQLTLKSLLNQTSPSQILIQITPFFKDMVDTIVKDHPLPPLASIFIPDSKPKFELPDMSYDHYYLTRIDSDDLFHNSVAAEIKAQLPRVRTLIYNTGYVYDIHSHHIQPYAHPSPPFYTDIFTKDEIVRGTMPKRKKHSSGIGSSSVLSSGKFVVVCHDTNDSSNWRKLAKVTKANQHIFKKTGNLPKITSLQSFGLDDSVINTTKQIYTKSDINTKLVSLPRIRTNTTAKPTQHRIH